MKSSTPCRRLMMAAGLAVLASLTMTGCSAYQTSHIQEPDPSLSINALATASDDDYALPVFSLVAADALGLATFGQEISAWDLASDDTVFVEAN